MTNEELYIDVCRMHFVEKLCLGEISEVYQLELKNYIHETKNRKFKFTNPFDAIVEIILNEEEAHLQAKNVR